ncbi:MAG: DNA internalization-related competence protein ComEC/Rec2 [Deltaproteobacteria bacterium]|nr:DNA internalization-related competence protein ComEC/Rec2 [Deltaproteobacteria bacterium]
MRLLPSLVLAQICGIVLADAGVVSSKAALAGALLALAAASFGVLRGRRLWAAAVLLVACSGALSHAQRIEMARGRRSAVAVERTLAATVDSLVVGAAGYRIDLRDVTAAGPEDARVPQRVRLYGEPTPAGLLAIERRLPGERVWLAARLRSPSQRRNPGSSSPDLALDRAGIGAVGSLLHPALQVRLPEREGLRPGVWIARRRAELNQRLAAAGRGAGLLRALALGDRRAPSPELNDAFARLGISHLLAVSGLHLALVASVAFGVARLTFGRSAFLAARCDTRGIALFVALAAALGYAFLTGWGVPVRRAAILLVGLALAFAGGRRRAAWPLLSAAALAVLAQEPGALFQPGAQLSFIATAALIAAARHAPAITQPRGVIAGYGESLLRASASVVALTAPVAALHFGRAAPFALVLNLVAIPWTACVLLPAAGFALVGAALEPGPWAGKLLRVTGVAAEWTGGAVTALDHALPIVPSVGPPSSASVCVLLALAGFSLLAKRTSSRVALAMAITLVLVLAPPRPVEPAPPRVVVLDVGQGDALIVQDRDAAILIDAGPALRSGFDFGARVVVPALAALGIRRLDLAIATHADLDHRGGLPAVLRSIPVRELWLPYGTRDESGFRDILELARRRGVRVRERGAGAASSEIGGMRVTPLWPPEDSLPDSRNDASLVVRVDVAGRRLLFPGDIERGAEAALVARGADLRAEVLALPHHGSRTSSSARFLAAVGAEVALVSAPCGGRYAMPHPDVVVRVRAHGLPLWWTGRDGALLVGLAGPLHVVGYADPEEPLPLRCRGPSS